MMDSSELIHMLSLLKPWKLPSLYILVAFSKIEKLRNFGPTPCIENIEKNPPIFDIFKHFLLVTRR